MRHDKIKKSWQILNIFVSELCTSVTVNLADCLGLEERPPIVIFLLLSESDLDSILFESVAASSICYVALELRYSELIIFPIKVKYLDWERPFGEFYLYLGGIMSLDVFQIKQNFHILWARFVEWVLSQSHKLVSRKDSLRRCSSSLRRLDFDRLNMLGLIHLDVEVAKDIWKRFKVGADHSVERNRVAMLTHLNALHKVDLVSILYKSI